MKRYNERKIGGIIIIAIAGLFLVGCLVMLLWNALMPVIFHLPLITFWQALGLLILAKLLFSSFRGSPKSRMKMDGLREGWAKMTPEQRENLKQNWGRRCGPFWKEESFRSQGAFHPDEPSGTGNTSEEKK